MLKASAYIVPENDEDERALENACPKASEALLFYTYDYEVKQGKKTIYKPALVISSD